MQAEIVQWEKSIKVECIFYIDVIRHQKGDWIELRIELQPLYSFLIGQFLSVFIAASS